MTRFLTALVLLPVCVWLILYAPAEAFLAAAAIVGLLAYREFELIARAQGIPSAGWIGAGLGVLWLLAPPAYAFAVLLVAALILMALAMRTPNLAHSLPYAAASVLGLLYIFGAWRAASALRSVNPHWLMIAFVVSWAGDTFAMYTGKAFGKHKLAPVISPGKTWEGAIGSVFGGVLVAYIYAYYLLPQVPGVTVALIAAVANIAGQLGDLAESAFKRGAGVKDSGSSLPGHGGWLDRVDSSLFSVPMTYALVIALIPS